MKIKEGLEISTGDFWYDLTLLGYLKPKEICAEKSDATRVIKAVKIIREFEKSCEEQIEDFVQ